MQIRRDHSSIRPTGSVCLLCDCGHDDDEEEAVFIRESITNEDPPNTHQVSGAAPTKTMVRLSECIASVHP